MSLMLALWAASATGLTGRIDAVAEQAKLAGVVLVAKGDTVLVEKGYGTIDPAGGAKHDAKARWRLASITKQITASLLLRDHAAVLDAPVARIDHAPLPGKTLNVTLRQLLTHHSGLANPDDTPAAAGGLPAFYTSVNDGLQYCLSKPPVPGSAFSYNNCDYIVAAAEMNGVRTWPAGMAMARGNERGVPGYVGGRPEPLLRLASFGAAGGLIGTARSVYRFDRSLMRGTLLSPPLLAALWTPEGGRSYQALGQWVFPGKLAGCAAPKRIVQRDGEIGGVQTRNYILPDDDMVVIVFTNRGSDDFPIGEIWQGKGFAYDLLSAGVCGKDIT